MKLQIIIISLFFSIIIINGCKKNKDTIPPQITFTSPVSNSSYNVLDSIPVKALISDNVGITLLSIQLVDGLFNGVMEVKSLPIASNSIKLEMIYELSDVNLTSAVYYLQITAKDQLHTTKERIKINVTGIPKIRLGLILSGDDLQGTQTTIWQADNNGTITQLKTQNGDFLGAGVNSKTQSIVTVGKHSGDMLSYSLNNKTNDWSFVNIPDPYTPYFSGFHYYDNESFLTFTGGEIRSFSATGIGQFSGNTTNQNIPYQIYVHHNFVMVEEKELGTGNKMMATYYKVSGTYKLIRPLIGNVAAFAPFDNNEFFVFTNLNGQGIIQLYSTVTNFYRTPYTFNNGEIVDVVAVGNFQYIIITNSKILRYNYQNASLVMLGTINQGKQIIYDTLNQEYIILEATQISFYDANINSLIKTIPLISLNVKDIHILYNR